MAHRRWGMLSEAGNAGSGGEGMGISSQAAHSRDGRVVATAEYPTRREEQWSLYWACESTPTTGRMLAYLPASAGRSRLRRLSTDGDRKGKGFKSTISTDKK